MSAVLLFGVLWFVVACVVSQRRKARARREVDSTLEEYQRYREAFNERFPEYRDTQWGKP